MAFFSRSPRTAAQIASNIWPGILKVNADGVKCLKKR